MSSAFFPPKKSKKEQEEEDKIQKVSIASLDVPFLDLVFILVKLSLAAIPAAIILAVFWVTVGGLIWDLVF